MRHKPDPYLRTCPWKVLFAEAADIVDTVRVSAEIDRLKLREAA